MDTLARLKQLLQERGWTEYKLSKECGLAQSTIGNIFRRNCNNRDDLQGIRYNNVAILRRGRNRRANAGTERVI